jgi:uncharacterized protein YbjT (DUF2867 family)
MIVVAGASGNTGSRTASMLLKKDQKVRAYVSEEPGSRNPNR